MWVMVGSCAQLLSNECSDYYVVTCLLSKQCTLRTYLEVHIVRKCLAYFTLINTTNHVCTVNAMLGGT